MARVGIEYQHEHARYVIRLETPDFIHQLALEGPDGPNKAALGLLMAEGVAQGLAMGFDAGIAAERVDPGQAEAVIPSRLDLCNAVEADPEKRDAIRKLSALRREAEDHPRILEWLTSKPDEFGQIPFENGLASPFDGLRSL